jgi:predicted nuclease with TOPRIM domain
VKLDIELIKADLAAGRTHDAAAYQHTVRQLIDEVERLQSRLKNLQEMLDALAEIRLDDALDEVITWVSPGSVWPGE